MGNGLPDPLILKGRPQGYLYFPTLCHPPGRCPDYGSVQCGPNFDVCIRVFFYDRIHLVRFKKGIIQFSAKKGRDDLGRPVTVPPREIRHAAVRQIGFPAVGLEGGRIEKPDFTQTRRPLQRDPGVFHRAQCQGAAQDGKGVEAVLVAEALDQLVAEGAQGRGEVDEVMANVALAGSETLEATGWRAAVDCCARGRPVSPTPKRSTASWPVSQN